MGSALEENLEKVLDDNSISVDDAINFAADGEVNANLLDTNESLDDEMDSKNLSEESLDDGSDIFDDDFDLDDMVDDLSGSNKISDNGDTNNEDFGVVSENSETYEEGDFSKLSDDFNFLEDEKKK